MLPARIREVCVYSCRMSSRLIHREGKLIEKHFVNTAPADLPIFEVETWLKHCPRSYDLHEVFGQKISPFRSVTEPGTTFFLIVLRFNFSFRLSISPIFLPQFFSKIGRSCWSLKSTVIRDQTRINKVYGL